MRVVTMMVAPESELLKIFCCRCLRCMRQLQSEHAILKSQLEYLFRVSIYFCWMKLIFGWKDFRSFKGPGNMFIWLRFRVLGHWPQNIVQINGYPVEISSLAFLDPIFGWAYNVFSRDREPVKENFFLSFVPVDAQKHPGTATFADYLICFNIN